MIVQVCDCWVFWVADITSETGLTRHSVVFGLGRETGGVLCKGRYILQNDHAVTLDRSYYVNGIVSM